MLPKDITKIQEYKDKLRKASIGNKSWTFRKTKVGFKLGHKINIGKIRSDKTKQKMSESKSGDKNPAKRPEVRKKIKETLKQKYKSGEITSCFQNKIFMEKLKKENSIRMKNGDALKARACVSFVDTSIEINIEEILNELELYFIKQYRIGKYFCDFYLPEYNLVIECDGEYWHNYPNYRDYDIKRDYFMLSKGYFGLRFWGREIKQKEKCKQHIKQVIGDILNNSCVCEVMICP